MNESPPITSDNDVRNAAILNALSNGVVIVDTALRVRFLNAAAQQLLGIGLGRGVGLQLNELLPDPAKLVELSKRVRDADQPLNAREVHLVTPVNTQVIDCIATPYDAEFEGVLLELFDVARTLRISREKSLLDQHQASRVFAGKLAHEIKNPLGGIRGAAQLLAQHADEKGDRRLTGLIIEEVDRLANLVDTMLGPVQAPKRRTVNAHELIERVLRLASAEVPEGVQFDRDYDPSLPDIEVDHDQIVQAILNLVRNALDAVGESGRIVARTRVLSQFTIGTQRHPLVVSIEIGDDGAGVPEALQETLFYPLVSGRDNGSGLGLSVAQDLVHRHGGLIEFENRPQETTFTILLPVKANT